MELPEPLQQRFQQELVAYLEEGQMPFLDFFDRLILQKIFLEAIEICLEARFGTEGLKLMPEVREIRDHVLLKKVLTRIKTAASPDDVRRVWTRKRRPKKAEPL
jgi:hypothetical protein